MNKTIEVGKGSLRLHYSADEGKLARYVNSRSKVGLCFFSSYFYVELISFSLSLGVSFVV